MKKISALIMLGLLLTALLAACGNATNTPAPGVGAASTVGGQTDADGITPTPRTGSAPVSGQNSVTPGDSAYNQVTPGATAVGTEQIAVTPGQTPVPQATAVPNTAVPTGALGNQRGQQVPTPTAEANATKPGASNVVATATGAAQPGATGPVATVSPQVTGGSNAQGAIQGTTPGVTGASGTTGASSPAPSIAVGGGVGNDALTQELQKLSGAELETRYMQYMIANQRLSKDMAELGQTKIQREELKSLANDIFAYKEPKTEDLQGWLQQWYNAQPLGDIPQLKSFNDAKTKLQSLSGADFEREFLNQQVQLAQQAVNMSTYAGGKIGRSELLRLSQEVTNVRNGQLQKMQNWQRIWFPAQAGG
jgi:uncharacterized protein (DUF305 family)/predicted small secreted protein